MYKVKKILCIIITLLLISNSILIAAPSNQNTLRAISTTNAKTTMFFAGFFDLFRGSEYRAIKAEIRRRAGNHPHLYIAPRNIKEAKAAMAEYGDFGVLVWADISRKGLAAGRYIVQIIPRARSSAAGTSSMPAGSDPPTGPVTGAIDTGRQTQGAIQHSG
ncbi:MAG: hypothetical protein HQ572_01405 [Candidatus Omnitrophica bacterium]|nr:hypothetical protein [Candidatus Omnitrophota bacterium]